MPTMATFFNEYFGVTTYQIDDHGAFNVSIINDLPLFIDPFLLFNSTTPEYQQLHADILQYMMFLRYKIISGSVNDDLVKAWFMFPEVKQLAGLLPAWKRWEWVASPTPSGPISRAFLRISARRPL